MRSEDAGNVVGVGRAGEDDQPTFQPVCNGEADDTSDRYEGYYRPEMGTIVVNELPRIHNES